MGLPVQIDQTGILGIFREECSPYSPAVLFIAMEASMALSTTPQFEPDIEAIKLRLIKHGVHLTPKILRSLRKKQILKHKRKLAKITQTLQPPPLTPSQKRALAEESHFQTVKSEYRDFSKAVKAEALSVSSGLLVGRPWEMIEKVKLKEIASGSKEFNGEKLKMENLRELKETFEDGLKWVLENDIEIEEVGCKRAWIFHFRFVGDPEISNF